MISVAPGQYSHIGLKKALDHYCRNLSIVPNEIVLDINVDGVPLSHSSAIGFWLILARVADTHQCSHKIFVVGVYYGQKKPKCFEEFLKPFVQEVIALNDYIFNDKHIVMKIRCVVCDAPARNACLGTKSYNGYFGCGRCCQESVYTQHRMTFPEIEAMKRTDESFRSKQQEEHHKYDSPILKFGIDMVSLDYLHTVCLGVVNKILNMWVNGKLRAKLQSSDVNIISERLEAIAKSQPSDRIFSASVDR